MPLFRDDVFILSQVKARFQKNKQKTEEKQEQYNINQKMKEMKEEVRRE